MGDKVTSEKTYPKFTKEQLRILDSLIGTHGKNRSDVVKNLVIMWLQEHSLLKVQGKEKS